MPELTYLQRQKLKTELMNELNEEFIFELFNEVTRVRIIKAIKAFEERHPEVPKDYLGVKSVVFYDKESRAVITLKNRWQFTL